MENIWGWEEDQIEIEPDEDFDENDWSVVESGLFGDC